MGSRPLTETAIRALKPAGQAFKVGDGGGLHLLVTPAGSKIWRLAYRASGQQRCLTHGPYPKLTLGLVRKRREEVTDVLRQGGDPGAPATTPVQERAFRDVALVWHATQSNRWTPAYSRQVLARIEADLFPDLADLESNRHLRTKLHDA